MGHPLKRLLAKDATRTQRESYEIVGNQQLQKSLAPVRNWYRLSHTYNMELHKVFRLNIPAVRRYQGEHKVLHFIGKDKPWHCVDGIVEMPEDPSPYLLFYAEMV